MTTAAAVIAVRATAGPSVIVSRAPRGASRETARALEEAARDALANATGPLNVQFSAWLADDGHLQFVCRVEAPPADPFGGEIQWRWWSAILDQPAELRESLSAAVASRFRIGAARAPDSPDGRHGRMKP